VRHDANSSRQHTVLCQLAAAPGTDVPRGTCARFAQRKLWYVVLPGHGGCGLACGGRQLPGEALIEPGLGLDLAEDLLFRDRLGSIASPQRSSCEALHKDRKLTCCPAA